MELAQGKHMPKVKAPSTGELTIPAILKDACRERSIN